MSFRADMPDKPVRPEHRVRAIAASQYRNGRWVFACPDR